MVRAYVDQVYCMCQASRMACRSCLHRSQKSRLGTERLHELEVKLKMVTHPLNRQQMEWTHR
jgi:hypothetical protein